MTSCRASASDSLAATAQSAMDANEDSDNVHFGTPSFFLVAASSTETPGITQCYIQPRAINQTCSGIASRIRKVVEVLDLPAHSETKESFLDS